MPKLKDDYVGRLLVELQDDPVLAAKLLLGVELAPHQRIALRKMWVTPWVMNVWGRGTGKTFMDGLYAALRALLFPNEKIIILGPGFRQAQLVFKEIELKAEESGLFADSIKGGLKGIKHGTSEWSIEFKNGSWIRAVPLGTDGAKIRGYRANRLIIDEFVQVPQSIIDSVAIPFMATSKDPMAKYLGKDTTHTGNTLVLSTSAYFTFNYGYKRYTDYLYEMLVKGNKDYYVSVFNYHDCPEGFIDMDVVEMSRSKTTTSNFRTEWLAEWVSDTEGFYPASLLDTVGSLDVKVEMRGEPGAKYILGVDPASVYNTCGFTIIKIGDPYKIVYTSSYGPIKYTEICSRILELMSRYNIVRIGLDKGAGIAIMDIFSEGRPVIDSNGNVSTTKLLAIDDMSGHEGRRIIQLVPATSESVNEINFGMKASMESGNVRWPKMALDAPIDLLEDVERVVEELHQLENEYRMIEATPTASGFLKFRVPEHRNKDRYSSSLFALHAAKTFSGELSAPQIELPTGFWGGGLLH